MKKIIAYFLVALSLSTAAQTLPPIPGIRSPLARRAVQATLAAAVLSAFALNKDQVIGGIIGRKELYTLADVCGVLLLAGLPRNRIAASLHVLGASSVRFMLEPGVKGPIISVILYAFMAVAVFLLSKLRNLRRLSDPQLWLAIAGFLRQQAAMAAARARAAMRGQGTAPAA